MTIKSFKFQAMVKPMSGHSGAPVESDAVARRMVVRAETSPTHGSQMFSALVIICAPGNGVITRACALPRRDPGGVLSEG